MPFTATEEDTIRKTIEETRVRWVIDRYFHCVDSQSWKLLAAIFAEDATFEFNFSDTEKKVLKGNQVIADYFQERNKIFRTKTHYVGHAEIAIIDNVAKADVFAISNVVIGEKIAIRGLRYADELVKGADGIWRFKTRLHKAQWQHYAAFVPPEVPKT